MAVLITAGLSPEAYRLKRILNLEDVVFADESTMPQIPGIRSLVIPSSSLSFVHEILKACLDLEVTKVYPLKIAEIVELANARALFEEYNVKLIIPSNLWLETNDHKVNSGGDNITVLENGQAVAGANLPESLTIENETGIFSWATNSPGLEYSLYIVADA